MLDGKSLVRSLREQLNEGADAEWLNDRTSYEYLYDAAVELVKRTNCLTAEQSITTTDDGSSYTLNADFLKLYLKDSNNNFFVKLYDGTSYNFILWKEYEQIVYDNNTTVQNIPDSFTIVDDGTLDAQITGTANQEGDATGGECTLTDTSSATKFADVSAGDAIHNTTDKSFGIVLSKTSDTSLKIALFDGDSNEVSYGDDYVIQPQGRSKLVFEPGTDTAGYTVTVYYVQRPAPVFSEYGIYRIPAYYKDMLVEYAAFKYKYRDREPGFGDTFFKYWDRRIRMASNDMNSKFARGGFTVSFKKRR